MSNIVLNLSPKNIVTGIAVTEQTSQHNLRLNPFDYNRQLPRPKQKHSIKLVRSPLKLSHNAFDASQLLQGTPATQITSTEAFDQF